MLVLALLAGAGWATTLTWDADTGTTGAQDGAGTWNTSASNWWDPLGGGGGGANALWSNTNPDSAIFGAGSGAAGTVTLGEAITAAAITFNAAGSGNYTIAGGGNTLTLSGTPTITANANATISATLGGTAGFTKNGTGTLTLSGVHTYSGATVVSQGTLKLNDQLVTIPNYNFETPAAPFPVPPANNASYWYNPTGASWTWPGGTGIAANNSAFNNGVAPEGTQVAFIQGTGNFSQSINFPADGTYLLSFLSAYRNASQGMNTFQVLVDGNVVGTFAPTTYPNTYLPYATNPFTVTAGNHTVQFLGLNTGGGDRTSFVDRVISASANALPTSTAVQIANGATLDLNGTWQAIASLADSGGGGGTLTNTAASIPVTLTLSAAAGTTAFSGTISDLSAANALSLIKAGASTQVLSGNNTYRGTTTVGGGTLQLGSATALGATAAGTAVASGATLDLNGQTVGAEPLTITGTGVGALGALINSSGTPASLSGNVGSNNTAFTVGGSGNITLGGNVTGSAAFTMTKIGTGTLTLGGTGDNSYFALTANAGTVVLAKTPSSGTVHAVGSGLTIGGALVQLGGTGGDQLYYQMTVTVNSGTLDFNGRSEGFGALNGAAAGTILNNATGTTSLMTVGDNNSSGTYPGVIRDNTAGTGIMALTKMGTGTETLSGTNLYTGTTTISGGQLRLNNASALPAGSALTINGGVLELQNPTSFTRTLAAGAGNVQITGGTSGFSSVVAGATINLNNNASTLQWGSATFAPSTLVLNDTTATQTLIFQNGLDLNAATRTINANANVATVNGAIVNNGGGTAGLTKGGAGTLVLPNTGNSYNGDTTVSAGTLRLGAANVIPDGAGKGNVTVNGTLDLYGNSEGINGLSGSGTVDNTSGAGIYTLTVGGNDASGTFSGTIKNTSGSVVLAKAGSGTETLSSPNLYSGGTRIAGGGKLLVSGLTSPASTALGSNIAGNMVSLEGGTLEFGTMTVPAYGPGLAESYILGTTSLNTTSPGTYYATTLNVKMATHFTGASATRGTVTDTIWGSNETWIYKGQFYDADGHFSFAENIDDVAWMRIDGVVRMNNGTWNAPTGTGDNFSFPGGSIMGPAGDGWHDIEIRFQNGTGGAGAVNGNGWTATYGFGLSGQGTKPTTDTATTGNQGGNYFAPADPGDMTRFRSMTGTAVITSLSLNHPVSVTANSAINMGSSLASLTMGTLGINTSTLALTGSSGASLTLGAVTMSGDPTFDVAANTTLNLGALDDGGVARTIGKSGAGDLTLGAAATSLVAGTQVNVTGGTLNSNNATALGALAALNVGPSGTFSLGASQAIGSLAGAGSVLLGANTLTVGGDGTSTSFGGSISGTGGLTKAGGGAFTLGGTCGYTGATNVNAGILDVNGSIAASSSVTVAAGATLMGSGTVGPLELYGTLAPGGSVGNLSAGDTTFEPDGVYEWEVNDLNGSPGSDPGWDQLTVANLLTIAATEADPFIIEIISLNGSVPGPANGVLGFSEEYRIVYAPGGVVAFDTTRFDIHTARFANDMGMGSFSLDARDDGLYLLYTAGEIPEPGTLTLLALGGLALLRSRRRSRGRGQA